MLKNKWFVLLRIAIPIVCFFSCKIKLHQDPVKGYGGNFPENHSTENSKIITPLIDKNEVGNIQIDSIVKTEIHDHSGRKFAKFYPLISHQNPADSSTSSRDERKYDVLTAVAWGLDIAGFAMLFISPAGYGLVLLLAGLIMALISKKRIESNPEIYKGRGWAIAAYVIPAVFLMLVLLIALLILTALGAF